MNNKLKLLINGSIFIKDDFEELVLKFTVTEDGIACEAKRSHKKPYELDHKSNLAFECLIGGDEITEDEYNKY